MKKCSEKQTNKQKKNNNNKKWKGDVTKKLVKKGTKEQHLPDMSSANMSQVDLAPFSPF